MKIIMGVQWTGFEHSILNIFLALLREESKLLR